MPIIVACVWTMGIAALRPSYGPMIYAAASPPRCPTAAIIAIASEISTL